MNVLILHNRYRHPGGEERSVSEIAELLRARGHGVELLERAVAVPSGVRGRGRATAGMLRGGLGPAEIAAAIRRSGAEVLHAHNINPLFGPRALAAAREAGARIVMHLHNYRLFCASGIAYRDGGVCTRCHGRNTLPGVRLRCRGSVPEAAVYGAGLALHQARVIDTVGRFVVPSRAAAERLASLGMPTKRVEVLPNFLREADFAGQTAAGEGRHALFAGRLVEEKGVEVAIRAAARARVPVAIAGSGPDADRLRGLARRLDAPVRFLGHLPSRRLAAARREAAFALVPSRWDEPCPYSVIEAMAAGLPVLASSVGGLAEMVSPEPALAPGDTGQWAAAMSELWEDRGRRRQRGAAALERARERFGAERFYSGLMDIYERAGAGT